jgi:hypothetical protein
VVVHRAINWKKEIQEQQTNNCVVYHEARQATKCFSVYL